MADKADKYASERGEPSGPSCADVSLLFDGYYLKLLAGPVSGGTVSAAWHARSGHKVGSNFDYSSGRQAVAFDGPIPEGEYWIQVSQIKVFVIDGEGWGDSRITIHPRPTTTTHSRGGFFIHGGKVFGSAGCIDLAYGMKSFRKKLESIAPTARDWWAANPCTIPLTVRYAATSVGDP
jgi:hypothetical protein